MTDVREGRTIPVPKHLRDGHYAGAKRLGSGVGYQYPHDHPNARVDQDYLGVDKTYYEPTDRGLEASFKKILDQRRAVTADQEKAELSPQASDNRSEVSSAPPDSATPNPS
jgi:putative ATPase